MSQPTSLIHVLTSSKVVRIGSDRSKLLPKRSGHSWWERRTSVVVVGGADPDERSPADP